LVSTTSDFEKTEVDIIKVPGQNIVKFYEKYGQPAEDGLSAGDTSYRLNCQINIFERIKIPHT
jgi:hypothetical protein